MLRIILCVLCFIYICVCVYIYLYQSFEIYYFIILNLYMKKQVHSKCLRQEAAESDSRFILKLLYSKIDFFIQITFRTAQKE